MSGTLPSAVNLAAPALLSVLRLPSQIGNAQLGWAVSFAGDMNGDGRSELFFGARVTSSASAPSLLLPGRADGYAGLSTADIRALAIPFTPTNAATFQSLDRAAAMGDVNRDGFGDLLVASQTGGNFLVFGSATLPASLDFSTVQLPSSTVRVLPANLTPGRSADIGGDGAGDPFVASGLTATLVYGGQTVWGDINLTTHPADQAARFTAATSISSLAAAGDLNGDGRGDLALLSLGGARAWLVFQPAAGFASATDLDTMAVSLGVRVSGLSAQGVSAPTAGGHLSRAGIAAVGDVNGDGFGDILIGDAYADTLGRADNGAAWLLFGKASGWASLDLASLAPADGIRISGAASGHRLGHAVSAAGDFNGDGFADLLVGAPGAAWSDLTPNGGAYVVLGRAGPWADMDLASLSLGQGVRFEGRGSIHAGVSVSGGMDFNGDGLSDIAIGAPSSAILSPSTTDGEAFVVFGQANGPLNLRGTSLADRLAGGALADRLSGLGGADTLRGNEGNDTIDGGEADDTLYGGPGADTLTGGAGDDTLQVDDSGDVVVEGAGGGFDRVFAVANGWTMTAGVEEGYLDGSANQMTGNDLANVLVGNIQASFLRGGGGDDEMWGRDREDVLIGDGGNDVLRGGLGADLMIGGLGDDTYVVQDSGDRVYENPGEGLDSAFVLFDGWVQDPDVEASYLQGAATRLDGSAVGDRLAANALLASTLSGNGGDDELWGAALGDTLRGGAGDDVLRGQGGDDLLLGGPGRDQLVGGAGADRFAMAAGAGGSAIVFDLSFAEGDRLVLAAGVSFAQLAVAVSGGNTRLTAPDGAVTDVYGRADLSAADFLFG